MGGKLLLTQNQVDAIKWLQSEGYTFDDIIHGQDYKWSGENVACLNTLSVAQVAKILYTDEYDVEKPEYKAGDKVVISNIVNRVYTLLERDFSKETNISGKAWKYNKGFVWDYERDFRLATPLEIYWLETLGREDIFDFRVGDAILDNDGSITPVTTDYQVNHAVEFFSKKPEKFKGVYPTESFKPYPEKE